MAQLTWSGVGVRYFETGADRGVLFVGTDAGVPWNGLTNISESPSGADPEPYYIDGFKYINLASLEEFEATIEALSAPSSFSQCDGTYQIANGLFVTQQRRKSFDMAYRTRVGNDLEGLEYGYKIHLIYAALAQPAEKSYATLSDKTDPTSFSWKITTTPQRLIGYKPSSHYIADTRYIPASVLYQLESILYGSPWTDSRMPDVDELAALFPQGVPFKLNQNDSGVYEIYEVDPLDSMALMGPTVPIPYADGSPLFWLDTSAGNYAVPKLVTP